MDKIKVKDVIAELQKHDPDSQFLVSSDEEMNTLFWGFEVAQLKGEKKVVIYGLSGREEDY